MLVTAELPRHVLAWADALRRAHYPPERNRLRAHVTLLHGLPPSAEGEVHRLLAELTAGAAPGAQIAGLMDLGRGTAWAVESPGMVALHAELAGHLRGVIQQKDARPLRLHVTVQNKVSRADAVALQAELLSAIRPRDFRFLGLGTYRWDGALWNFEKLFRFRG
jgi:hypothetical protein